MSLIFRLYFVESFEKWLENSGHLACCKYSVGCEGGERSEAEGERGGRRNNSFFKFLQHVPFFSLSPP
jgi:hypothetical protein